MNIDYSGYRPKEGSGRITMLLTALLAGLLIALMAAIPAYAELAAVSKKADGTVRTDATGYPAWYRDANGADSVRLKVCVDNANCLGGDPRPDRTQPATIANGNLQDEAFYSAAETDTTLENGGKIKWRGVLEAAFGGTGVVRDGRQVVFTRTQVVGSNIDPVAYPEGTVLTFSTPYGTMSGTVTAQGTLKTRKESPLGTAANGFAPPVTETRTGFGPRFIKWDPAVTPAAPAGFLGNGRTPHAIIGGDLDALGNPVNTFQVLKDGDPVSPRVKRFVVAGQCFQGTC